ncbi:MAG: ribosomal-processing cysteine protease Prp [Anaerosolibacter sp.]|jgi:uncharacterized protein YsxB (DUF464 family)|uniref:ribosomal-processing cysteine protease Prp n=1 Tax=Anaerosolibacter sp. TaxID=1872527 RepID=UPI00260C8545|nr:ribosomal-processing cysteine protease Prp [Anaerosolibacter sp.]MDF2547065.1 ribosomal-processing cysteine protease Prp [Anaerosolibacter sp.]
MIKIIIERDIHKRVIGYTVEGHANAAEYGQDIVCASISVLAQTAILALHDLLSIHVIYEMEDGWISCKLPNNLSDKLLVQADLILSTMLIGMKATHNMYSKYIELHDREV